MATAKRPTKLKSSATIKQISDPASVEVELASFIDKFEPSIAKLIRECRVEVRRLLPTAVEIVYDNYNFFVIGYSSSERPSDCIVSIAAASNGVGLSFYRGASVPDPEGLLQGEGKQNRFIRLSSAERLRAPGVVRLVHSAESLGKTPLPKTGDPRTMIKSVSSKQRPRRKGANDA
jgi:hypothetical protein